MYLNNLMLACNRAKSLRTLYKVGNRDVQLTAIEECLHQNGRKLLPDEPPKTTVCELPTSRVALSNTSQIGLNTTQTQETPTKPLVKQVANRDWDAKADELVMNATRHGQQASQIVKTLTQKGYTATETIVMDIARKQGGQKYVSPKTTSDLSASHAQNISPAPMVGLAGSNFQADTMVTNSHGEGQKESQIAKTSVREGYAATETNVMENLHEQGLPEEVTTFVWNAQAESFALAAARMDTSVSDITAQLCQKGYTVTIADVTANLHKQGVLNLSW